MIEALVFDMDGLIFDSERIVQRSWEDSGEPLGLTNMGSHIYNTLGMNAHSRREYFEKAVGSHFPHEEFAELTRVRFREIVEQEGLPVKPGVRELITYAKDQGIKLAVATSTRREHASVHLKDAGLYDYFDGLVYGDMVHRSKPDPEIYVLACHSIEASAKRSIALEDSPAGIRSSHAAGMLPVMVPDLVQPPAEIEDLLFRRFETLLDVIPLLEEINSLL